MIPHNFGNLNVRQKEDLKKTEYITIEPAEDFLSLQVQLLNAIEQSVIATDLNGIVIYWNRCAEQLYGWSIEEAMGRHIMKLTTPKPTVRQAEEIMSQLRQSKSWTGEFIAQRKDGTTFPIQITNSPIYDNKQRLIGIVGLSNDITERKRREQMVIESENKYRVLIDQASDGIHTYDMQGNFIETNSRLCEMLGYTAEELLRLNVKDLVSPEDLVANPIRFNDLRDGKTVLNERRLLRKDGTLISVEVSGKMIRSGVLQAIIRDTTERKRGEELLKQSEELLRSIFEASHDGILVENNETISYVNKSYVRLFGYDDAEELIGQHISFVISSEDVERVTEYGKARLHGGHPPLKYEFKGKRKDGNSVDVEASVSISNAVHHTYITTMVRDISERKRMEATLHSQADRLRLITDAIPLLVSYVDKDYHYRFVNQTYTEWFGQAREKVIGRHLSDVLGQAAYQAILPEVEKALSGEKVVFERHVPYKNGERFIHLNYIPEFDTTTEQVIGFHAFVQDITERKKAEEVLQRSREELEVIVKERTTELEKANEERIRILQQLVTAQENERRRLARDLHDQLGQQLTALRLKLEVFKKMCDGNEALLTQVSETQKIVRNLDLDVDFIAWKVRPTLLDDFGIVAALDQYIRQWSAYFNIPAEFDARRSNKIQLESEVETNFYRITQESLNNIYKHARASKVNVSLEPRDGSVVLIIEDNGVGFEPDKQIFVEKGMGLMGMDERAALIGGKLEIESAMGVGTTIYVSVPISKGRKEKNE